MSDLLKDANGFAREASVSVPQQAAKDHNDLVPEARLLVKAHPDEAKSLEIPNPHRPAHTCALFGGVPNGGARSLVRITEILHRYGGLRVPTIRHIGEDTSPEKGDCTVSEILPRRPFDWESHRMGRHAARALGDHLGRLHAATVRTDGFGVFGGEIVRWTQWWPRFAASYALLADEVCKGSPALRGYRWRLDLPLAQATRSPDPRTFPLICVDQSPSHYLDDERGGISGFIDVEGHLFAPAEWELTTVMMWMPNPCAFQQGYERHRIWPTGMEAVRGAYASYALLERIRRTRLTLEPQEDVSALEAWLIGTLV